MVQPPDRGFDGEVAGGSAVVIALGSNLGDRAATLGTAITDIADLNGLSLTAQSGLFESVAMTPDGADDSRPPYLNAVLVAVTNLLPHALLDQLHQIEARHGRERAIRWGDRTLDLDIIDYAGMELTDDVLILPHPEAARRDFVLVPWISIDPHAAVPGFGPIGNLPGATSGNVAPWKGAE